MLTRLEEKKEKNKKLREEVTARVAYNTMGAGVGVNCTLILVLYSITPAKRLTVTLAERNRHNGTAKQTPSLPPSPTRALIVLHIYSPFLYIHTFA